MLIDIPLDAERVQELILRLKNKDDVKVRREAARCCLKPPSFIKALPEKFELPEEYKELKKELIKALKEAETNDGEDCEVRRDAWLALMKIKFNIA